MQVTAAKALCIPVRNSVAIMFNIAADDTYDCSYRSVVRSLLPTIWIPSQETRHSSLRKRITALKCKQVECFTKVTFLIISSQLFELLAPNVCLAPFRMWSYAAKI
jgi:hypothetical protein